MNRHQQSVTDKSKKGWKIKIKGKHRCSRYLHLNIIPLCSFIRKYIIIKLLCSYIAAVKPVQSGQSGHPQF